MNDRKLVDPRSYIFGMLTLIFTFGVMFHASRKFSWSLAAAFFAAVMVWGAYLTLRWIYLAIK